MARFTALIIFVAVLLPTGASAKDTQVLEPDRQYHYSGTTFTRRQE